MDWRQGSREHHVVNHFIPKPCPRGTQKSSITYVPCFLVPPRTIVQKDFNLTQTEIASKLGLTRDYVGQRMRLLTFPEELQEFVSHDTISVSVAETIASAPQDTAVLLPELYGRSPGVLRYRWSRRYVCPDCQHMIPLKGIW